VAVKNLAQATNPYAQIVFGALPEANSIAMAIADGGPEETFLDKGARYSLDVVLNGKHAEQDVVLDALASIHEALTRRTTYPDTGGAQITNIITTNAPSYLDREKSQWLYGSSLRVEFLL